MRRPEGALKALEDVDEAERVRSMKGAHAAPVWCARSVVERGHDPAPTTTPPGWSTSPQGHRTGRP
jgi:hypothetical protein